MPYGISSHGVKSDIFVLILYISIVRTHLTLLVVYLFCFVKSSKLTLQHDITKWNMCYTPCSIKEILMLKLVPETLCPLRTWFDGLHQSINNKKWNYNEMTIITCHVLNQWNTKCETLMQFKLLLDILVYKNIKTLRQ